MKTDRKTELLSVSILPTLPGWNDLDAGARQTVETETRQLEVAYDGVVRSRLAIGESLTRIHKILEPRRMFSKFCEVYNINRSTANYAIQAYANASKTVPAAVLKVATARGMNMSGILTDEPLGKYTDAVKRLPPPKTTDTAKIVEWLDQVETYRLKQRRKKAAEDPDPEELLKETYRFVSNKMDRVPSRRRRVWFQRLVGFGLAEIGVSNPLSFDPEAAPDDFRAVVGRPKLAA